MCAKAELPPASAAIVATDSLTQRSLNQALQNNLLAEERRNGACVRDESFATNRPLHP